MENLANLRKDLYGKVDVYSYVYNGWRVHSRNKTIWIAKPVKPEDFDPEHRNSLIVKSEEVLEKLIFDPEKKTIEAIVSRSVSEKIPRKVDLSEVPELFDEIREKIEDVITFKPDESHTTPLYYKSVVANEDRTVFEVK